MIVYVATISTYWEVTAVADSEAGAKRLAAELALAYLEHVGAKVASTDTVDKVIAYFEPRVTMLAVNTAVFSGNEKVLPHGN